MVKKAKKRGVKPGTKRGKYKRNRKPSSITLDKYSDLFKNTAGMKVGDTLRIKLPKDYVISDGPKAYAPSPVLTLCGQLEDAILLLENRLSNAIAKINSLM